jgi:glycosyltransferase involved in cell wall biosynthesis
MPIPFYVFSYNRGPFLENCVASIRRNAPGAAITVVDDGSNDPETIRVLKNLPADVRLLRQEKQLDAKLGGLYRNMQIALDGMDPQTRLFAFLQDDTQVVRPLEPDDYDYMDRYFEAFPKAAFLNPHFLKGVRKRGILRAIYPDSDFPVYFYKFSEFWKDRSVTMYFTDICVGHASRLKKACFSYQSNETTSGQLARSLFSKMGTMAHPFVMSLPEVPIYRGKRKTLGVRLAEKRLGTEPNAFAMLGKGEVAALKSRSLNVLPFAEDFLSCTRYQPKTPFVKESVNAFPMLKLLHKIELQFRKVLR